MKQSPKEVGLGSEITVAGRQITCPAGTAEAFDKILLANPVVTRSGSRFQDDLWDLTGDTLSRLPSGERKIDILARPTRRDRCPLGPNLTLADFPRFHEIGRRWCAALFLVPRSARGRPYSVRTIVKYWKGYLAMVRVLVKAGSRDFENLGSDVSFELLKGKPCERDMMESLRTLHLYSDLLRLNFGAITPRIRKREDEKQTLPIPDEMLNSLLRSAFSWLEVAAPLVEYYRGYVHALGRTDRAYYFRRSRRPECAWGVQIDDVQGLLRAMKFLRLSAVVVILALTGMRIEELMSIRVNAVRKIVFDGVTYTFLSSVHQKYAKQYGGEEALWLCGKPGEAAYSILCQISEAFRSESGSEFIVGPLGIGGSIVRSCESGSVIHAMFNSGARGVGDWPDYLAASGISTADCSVHIASHQFRRTFARMAARSGGGLTMLALQDHFKHASILMSLYYAKLDCQVYEWFEEERNRMYAEAFDQIVCAESLGGIGGQAIKKAIDSAIDSGQLRREFRGAACREEREAWVKRWIASGIFPRMCNGHYCVPRDPNFRCEAESGGIGCNEMNCPNQVFLPEHAPALRLKIEQERQTLQFFESIGKGATPAADKIRLLLRAQEAHLRKLA